MDNPLWWATLDGDVACKALYDRHYSGKIAQDKARKGRPASKLFVTPGFKRVFRTWHGDACFVWVDHIDDGGQEGIYCSFFRNETSHRASRLVEQADAIADHIWPNRRHYTAQFAEAHFAVMPFELARRCIVAGCPEGGTVLDPFNGSGTTGLVALANRCNYIGIELNPEYAAMAMRRLDEASAQESLF